MPFDMFGCSILLLDSIACVRRNTSWAAKLAREVFVSLVIEFFGPKHVVSKKFHVDWRALATPTWIIKYFGQCSVKSEIRSCISQEIRFNVIGRLFLLGMGIARS